MYENGKRIKGYQRKRLHKRKIKGAYANIYSWDDWTEFVSKHKDEPRNSWGHPLDYWKKFSLSERRTYAKAQTNRRIRRHFRDYVGTEDIEYLSNSEYKRFFDYNWEVF